MANLWYLSPSSQYGNVGVGDYGTEAEQMNLLMDEIAEHLDRHGVEFYRADRYASIEEKAAESDRLGADWYFALHSNAGGNGQAWGPIAFHGGPGRELAERLVKELLATGQKNNRSANVQNGSRLYEVNRPKARSCLLEVDFHDSAAGAGFIMNRRSDAAKAIARAIVVTDGKTWSEPAVSGDDGASGWARPYTEKARALGLFTGDSRGYRWQGHVTREELAAALIRLKEKLEDEKRS